MTHNPIHPRSPLPMSALKAITAALLALSLPHLAAVAADEIDTRGMHVEQVTITSVAVPPSNLKLSLTTDRESGIYTEGERARLFLKVNQDARVVLLDVDSQGVKTVLFPNACQTDNRLKAGQRVEVGVGRAGNLVCPGIRVTAPHGLSTLTAVATTSASVELPGVKAERGQQVFAPLPVTSQEYVRGMQVVVTEAPKAKFASRSLRYSVVPAPTVAATPAAGTTPAATVAGTTTTVVTGATQVTVTTPDTTVQVTESPDEEAPAEPTPAPAPYALPPLQSDFGLVLTVDQPSYRVGEQLKFSVAAERRCDLRIVNIDHKGDYTILYPTKLDEALTLKEGRTEFFPRAKGDTQITLVGEPGQQTLLAVCAQNRTFWDVITGRTAIAGAKPTMTLSQILSDKGDGLVGRKAVTYQLSR